MRKKKKFSGLTLMCLPMLACGSSGGSSNKISLVDAAGSGHVFKDAPAQQACQAKTSYSVTFGSNDTQNAQAGSNANQAAISYLGNLSEANPIDLLDIELWIGGTGTDFPTALGSGTFDLSAKGDTDYSSCDSCVFVWPQVAFDGSSGQLTGLTDDYIANEQYMAKSGTLKLTSVVNNITGTLSNVALRHVMYDGSNNQSDATDGCTTTISSVSFTAPISAATFDSQKNGYHLSLRNRHR